MSAIGVFDSGVGGLTVLKALREHWPGEDFIYLADTARLPYGNKSLHTIHNYTDQNIRFLMQYKVKAIVVACNSASTALLEQPIPCTIPLLNVVEPGAQAAARTTKTKRIGVLGTRATVLSEAYPHALKRLDTEFEVFQQPCPLWVPLVEEGWTDDPITNLIVYRYLSGMAKHQVDTLILGCTHYPALRAAIQKVVGSSVELVDSAPELIRDIEARGLLRETKVGGTTQLLCTDYSPRLAETVVHILGPDIEHSLEPVDLT